MPREETAQGGVELGFLDTFSQAALLTDEECRIVTVNAAAEQLTGLRRDVLLQRRLAEAVFSGDHQDAFREVSGQVLTGVSWLGELDAVRADGSIAQVEVTCAPLRREGEVVGLACVMSESGQSVDQDHTAQRLADRLTGLARVAAELAVAE